MSELNKRQKDIINEWFDNNFKGLENALSIVNIPQELKEKLIKINNYRNINQDIASYIINKTFAKLDQGSIF